MNEDGREQAGMGATTADYDGDGRLDIFKTNFSNDTNTLYRNLGNFTFDDVTSAAGLAVHTQYVKWGTAFLDFDNDGWPDLFVADGHVYLFVEKYNLGEEFKQPSTVGGRKEIDEVRSGGYHISQGDLRVHFGMGHATKADLTIRWPDGAVGNVETIPGVDANQWIVVRQGRGIVRRHPFTHDVP